RVHAVVRRRGVPTDLLSSWLAVATNDFARPVRCRRRLSQPLDLVPLIGFPIKTHNTHGQEIW
ncbi:MAG: hypothetical protein M3362_05970, partial [Acidobacteriota bacterium]|nr:hypothetical protein [Acidobacteriota bacterium]